ncbi:DUF4259 domain-containing protein [Streptomyces sp. NPDC000927]|uniref:DUF4259 domain-containing protein n=1 Tax=Streptomyces sp. NPDC000927 TaxID=3154371 RepID=UPI0033335EAA
MGTFGTGPFDNDTALDLKDHLAAIPEMTERCEVLTSAMKRLRACDPNLSSPAEVSWQVLEEGVAACAVIVDKLHGTYLYLPEAEDDEDLSLDMVPRIDMDLARVALQAMFTALRLAEEPKISSSWMDRQLQEFYAEDLSQLFRKLGEGISLLEGEEISRNREISTKEKK